MKKIIILFLLVFSFSHAQKKQIVNAKLNICEGDIEFEQYDLIKKVNQFYPEVLVSKNVKNVYKLGTGKKIVPTLLVCDLPEGYSRYILNIGDDNLNLLFNYKTSDGGVMNGIYTLMGNNVFKTEYYFKADYKITRFYRNGKLIFSDSPENEISN